MKMKILAIALIGTLFLLATGPMVQALESDSVEENRAIIIKQNGDLSPEDDGLESDSIGGNEATSVERPFTLKENDLDDGLESDSLSGEVSIRK